MVERRRFLFVFCDFGFKPQVDSEVCILPSQNPPAALTVSSLKFAVNLLTIVEPKGQVGLSHLIVSAISSPFLAEVPCQSDWWHPLKSVLSAADRPTLSRHHAVHLD